MTLGINLQVMATVCGQGGTNTTAIDSLVEETRRQLLQEGKEYKMQGFCINGGSEIVVLYNVPHLLKCVRNNFIEKDVIFNFKNRTMKARWRDVLAVYRLDQTDSNARMLLKVSYVTISLAFFLIKCLVNMEIPLVLTYY